MLESGSLGMFFPAASSNQYVYSLTDHLGNARVTISRDKSGSDAVVLSYADYYAWGMTMPGRELTSNPRFRLGYQGQEYEQSVGMYGFSLRMYDQRLGRWHATDPYEQHWSPYLAMSNNPVSFVDPDGGWDEWWDKNKITYVVDGAEVDPNEFRNYISGASPGSSLQFGGSMFAGLSLPNLTFSQGRGFGMWVNLNSDYQALINYDVLGVEDPNETFYGNTTVFTPEVLSVFVTAGTIIGQTRLGSALNRFTKGPENYNRSSNQPLLFAWAGSLAGEHVTEEGAYTVVRGMLNYTAVSSVYAAYNGREMLPEQLNGERRELGVGERIFEGASVLPIGKIADKVGDGIGFAKKAGWVGKGAKTGTSLTKSQLKSIGSLEKQIATHTEKLKEYKADPFKFDNKDFLKNAPNDAVRQKIIQSRINHLEQEINTFQSNIQKILSSQ